MMSAPKPPTAVYITDPSVAVGLLNEARNMNMEIPRDLSVLGFDDRDSRDYVSPKLTAICQNAVDLGKEAFSRLAQFVQSSQSRESHQASAATSWLELNQTTGPPAEMR